MGWSGASLYVQYILAYDTCVLCVVHFYRSGVPCSGGIPTWSFLLHVKQLQIIVLRAVAGDIYMIVNVVCLPR